ncbi:MAG: mechanosensitive ion channel domain-containing protein [Mariniblastus sp.]
MRSDSVTMDQLDDIKQKLQDSPLDDAKKQMARASLTLAEENLQRIATSEAKTLANERLTETAEQRAEKIKKQTLELSRDKANIDPLKPAIAPESIPQAAKDAAAELVVADEELRKLQTSIVLRNEESTKSAQLLAGLKQRRDALDVQLRENAASIEPPLVSQAKTIELLTRSQWVDAELKRLMSESALFDAEQKFGVQVSTVELLTLNAKLARTRSETLEKQLSDQRRVDTQEAVAAAKGLVSQVPELLKPLAEENVRIADLATDILAPMRSASAELTDEEQKLKQIKSQFLATKNRVTAVGLTASVGAYLRNRKTEIPREGWLTAVAAERIGEIEKYQSQQFDLTEQADSLLSEVILNQVEADARLKYPELSEAQIKDPKTEAATIAKARIESLRDDAAELIKRRRELLTQAINNHKAYLTTLTNLRNTEKQLTEKTSEFHEYINERILWIRSNDVLFSDFSNDKSDQDLYSAEKWTEVGTKIFADLRSHILTYSFSILLFISLFMYRIRMRDAIKANSTIVSRGSNTDFTPTLRTLFLSVAVSILYPLLMFTVGWRLQSVTPTSALSIALGNALVNSAWFYFLTESLRQVCRKNGLAEKHFGWSAATVSKLNSELDWFVPFGAITSFACSLLYFIDINHENDLIERIAFLVAIGSLTFFLFRIFHPVSGMYREQILQNPKAWLVQSKSIWFWAIMLLPVVLMGMVVVGYYYSAIQMVNRLFSTVVIVIGFEICRSLLDRFILLSRRKARIEQSRARLLAQKNAPVDNAQAAELQRAADQEAFLAEASATIDENVLRSQKLVSAAVAIAWVVAISIIWADVFPALRGLDRFQLWTTAVDIAVAEEDTADGKVTMSPAAAVVTKSESTSSESNSASPATNGDTASEKALTSVTTRREVKSITLRHLLIAIFILIVSIFAVRNFPAFLELMFLKHLPVEQSVRHAVKAITGYIILLVGVVAAGRSMYIGWSQIQWLATALTFGLAFGLQEIFANFIAGIILLLERPIRIGDVISVDNVTGTVSKIRIRATTITDFDRKDYVVPNKEFITGRVLNWTLSDKVNRMIVRVGIAYGSDVRRAKEILRDICVNHPAVVESPPTTITFEEFGDSTLNLTARTFLKDFDSRWPTLDAINLAIDDAYKAEGIEIAFPQRDLHIRTASSEFEATVRNKLPEQQLHGSATPETSNNVDTPNVFGEPNESRSE